MYNIYLKKQFQRIQINSSMKNNILFSIAVSCILLLSCNQNSQNQNYDTTLIKNPNTANETSKSEKMPKIIFEKKLHDFGRLSEGENIAYSFKFTNTGDANLLISNCDATCGCTVADFPKNPIKPGETGFITVTFNSTGKRGRQEQMVDVMANTQPNRTQLVIRAMVEN